MAHYEDFPIMHFTYVQGYGNYKKITKVYFYLKFRILKNLEKDCCFLSNIKYLYIIIIRAEKIGSEAFFFLDTTKGWLFLDLFIAIFLISLASSIFSPGRIWDEILLRYVVLGAPGRRDDLILDS